MNFAFKLYKLMADQPDSMLSPLIISLALTMTSFGTGGNTLQQMSKALDLTDFSDRAEIAKGYAAILKSLEVLGETSTFILNRVALRKDFSVKKPFQEVLVDDFGTQHVPVHYLKGAQDSFNKSLSECAEQTTKFNFTSVLSFHSANGAKAGAAEAFHLASVIYFSGAWTQPFCKENTVEELFHGIHGSTQSIPMMNARGQFHIVQDEFLDSKILKFEYTGLRFAMYVILPNKVESFRAVKENLDAHRFRHIRNHMHLREVAVKLPKYMGDRLQYLHLDLKNLGITDLEDGMSADLREMAEAGAGSGEGLFARKVLYSTHVELGNIETSSFDSAPVLHQSVYSEVSANGSAIQAVSYTVEKKQKEAQVLEFYANRPFVFIIHDALTDLILLMGNLDNFAKMSYLVTS